MDPVILFINLTDLMIYSSILMDPMILLIYSDGLCDSIH